MSGDTADQIVSMFYALYLGAFPVLLGIWVLKRWIFD